MKVEIKPNKFVDQDFINRVENLKVPGGSARVIEFLVTNTLSNMRYRMSDECTDVFQQIDEDEKKEFMDLFLLIESIRDKTRRSTATASSSKAEK